MREGKKKRLMQVKTVNCICTEWKSYDGVSDTQGSKLTEPNGERVYESVCMCIYRKRLSTIFPLEIWSVGITENPFHSFFYNHNQMCFCSFAIETFEHHANFAWNS